MALSTYAGERSLGYTTKQVDASGNNSVNMTMTSVISSIIIILIVIIFIIIIVSLIIFF
jgi:uncharacterized Tic20 family protein